MHPGHLHSILASLSNTRISPFDVHLTVQNRNGSMASPRLLCFWRILQRTQRRCRRPTFSLSLLLIVACAVVRYPHSRLICHLTSLFQLAQTCTWMQEGKELIYVHIHTYLEYIYPKNILFFKTQISSGVNSSLARVLKPLVPKLDKQKKDVQLFIIGDKGRAQLGRPLGEFITQVNSDSAAPYNFSLVSQLNHGLSLSLLKMVKTLDAVSSLNLSALCCICSLERSINNWFSCLPL